MGTSNSAGRRETDEGSILGRLQFLSLTVDVLYGPRLCGDAAATSGAWAIGAFPETKFAMSAPRVHRASGRGI